MLLFDATHTSHTQAQTGIQRVCRSLFAALAARDGVAGVCHDPYLRAWRLLNPAEGRRLRPGNGVASSRGAKWPWHQRLAGHSRRLLKAKPRLPHAAGAVFPELFSPRVGAALTEIFAAVPGPRVAIFHDAIGLRLPELTPAGTVARLPAYLRELLQFDGVAAVSEDSAASLREYWEWLGVPRTPVVQAIPSGVDPLPPGSDGNPPPTTVPRILCVGTIEGRKNHLALLEACESLWAASERFELELLGLARADTAAQALARIQSLQQAGRPVSYRGAVGDVVLQAAFRQCSFTVYPSLQEGFGLPVIESLQHGKPCICSGRGALGESARGGGCLALDTVDAGSLAGAIRRLLQDRDELARLTAAARHRRFKTWTDCARELSDWMLALPLRRNY